MDILKNKSYVKYDYTSRYADVPYYYNSVDDKYMYGLGHNMDKNIDFVSHKVTQEDTLDSLALTYYNNPTLWWVIAYFNDIQDALIHLSDRYNIINIPSISQINFKDER